MGQGQLLLTGQPTELTHLLRGRLWQREIARIELEHQRQQPDVIAHQYVSGKLVVTLLNDTPPLLAQPKEPTLEDVYFATLSNHQLTTP